MNKKTKEKKWHLYRVDFVFPADGATFFVVAELDCVDKKYIEKKYGIDLFAVNVVDLDMIGDIELKFLKSVLPISSVKKVTKEI